MKNLLEESIANPNLVLLMKGSNSNAWCHACNEVGADFVKTLTAFGTGGQNLKL